MANKKAVLLTILAGTYAAWSIGNLVYERYLYFPFKGHFILLSYVDNLGETAVTLSRSELLIARTTATQIVTRSDNCVITYVYEGMEREGGVLKFKSSKSTRSHECESGGFGVGPSETFNARREGNFLYWQKNSWPYTEKYQTIE
jgi:hypothetical protein